jgi:hypothetical protein
MRKCWKKKTMGRIIFRGNSKFKKATKTSIEKLKDKKWKI